MSTRTLHTTAPGKARLPLATMLILAWRNLWRHRRRTVVTLVSIAFGFGLAVVMIGFTDGGHNNMIRNAIKLGEGHITVQPRGYLENPANHRYLADGKALASQIQALDVPGSVEPRISLQVLASTPANSVGAGLEDLGKGLRSQIATMYGSLLKGPRYLEMAEGYVMKLALDENGEICGYQFCHLGKMMEAIKKGVDPKEAYEKNVGTYGRFDDAASYIDPRHQ